MRQTRDRTQIDPIRIATNTALKPIRVGTVPMSSPSRHP